MSEYYISLGSNMGKRADFLRRAAGLMGEEGIPVKARSGIYETRPWGKTNQALFLNAVILAVWNETPEELLRRLLRIESRCGRERRIHWGPRTLDLDLIYGEGVVRDSDFLRLPHPYFWDRAFVLAPMADISPDFTFRGETIEHRLETLGWRDCVRRTEETWEAPGHGK